MQRASPWSLVFSLEANQIVETHQNYLQLRPTYKQDPMQCQSLSTPPAGGLERYGSGQIRTDALTQFLTGHPQLTESIIKDKPAEAAAVKENAPPKSTPAKKDNPSFWQEAQG
ncbi:hypothetical protein FCOIX_2087 [Fusarium coicis]|nr:hypothetical protein FCOIX_2087 [Fusarium coicis]